jgi:hypothetical protein
MYIYGHWVLVRSFGAFLTVAFRAGVQPDTRSELELEVLVKVVGAK